MNCSALSLDEDDATATTWWATSEASRTLGSIRRSFVNTVGNKLFHGFLSYPSIVEVEILLSAIQPVATNQLALFFWFSGKQNLIPIIPHRTMCGAMMEVNVK
jgi:hypothetical protein